MAWRGILTQDDMCIYVKPCICLFVQNKARKCRQKLTINYNINIILLLILTTFQILYILLQIIILVYKIWVKTSILSIYQTGIKQYTIVTKYIDKIQIAAADMRYFTWSKFSRSLVHNRKFGLIYRVAFKLENTYFVKGGRMHVLS